MKCQILFSGKIRKNKNVNLSAEFPRVVKVKPPITTAADNILILFFFLCFEKQALTFHVNHLASIFLFFRGL